MNNRSLFIQKLANMLLNITPPPPNLVRDNEITWLHSIQVARRNKIFICLEKMSVRVCRHFCVVH